MQFLIISFCGLSPGFGAHVPHFGHQSMFGVVLTSGRSLCSTFPHESADPAWNCAPANSFHTTHFHQRTVDLLGVFPRNVSILMYARWSSLVTVPETRTAAISTLCRFHVHIPPETKYTALASRSSPVQLLKWWDRWRHYLRSVANVCISFEITLVFYFDF